MLRSGDLHVGKEPHPYGIVALDNGLASWTTGPRAGQRDRGTGERLPDVGRRDRRLG